VSKSIFGVQRECDRRASTSFDLPGKARDESRTGATMNLPHRRLPACLALVAVLALAGAPARAAEMKYPVWPGQWDPINPGFGGQLAKYDPTKAFGLAQQAPLTPEYKKVHEESMADQAEGGHGNFLDHARCLPGGMPFMMSIAAMEFIITPETTYISVGSDMRRIFTDGRPWPAEVTPTYQGYAIGRWIDADGSGTYSVLEAETRGPFKGPRAFDATGLPLAFDNQSIFKERFHLDRINPNLLHDEITTIDHALTRPWSVDKTFRHNPNLYPPFSRVSCMEGAADVVIGRDYFYLSADGLLMPVKKNQPPPDLRYFKQAGK
jgi:hypothetical protein